MKEEKNKPVKEIEGDLAKMLQESLETNREILRSVKFIKTYFRWRTVWNVIKIVILVLVVVFGAISYKTALNYLQGYTTSLETYSEQLNQLNSFKDLMDIQKR